MNSPAWPTRVAHTTQRVRERTAARGAAHSTSAYAETARGGEIPHALTFLQNRPRTFPKLQLSTNTISPISHNFSINPLAFP